MNEISNDLGEEERQDVDDVVHDLLAEPKEVVEVDLAVLLVEGLTHFLDELRRKVQVFEVVEPLTDDDPEEVHDEVVESALVVL